MSNEKCHTCCNYTEIIGFHKKGILVRSNQTQVRDIKWSDIDEEFGLSDHGISEKQFISFLYSNILGDIKNGSLS